MTDHMTALLELALEAAAPEDLTSKGLKARFGLPEAAEPSTGQVWRARWEEDSLLVLVLGVRGSQVEVAPITIEPTGQDDRSVVVSAEATAFGVDTTAWCGLRGELPYRVLDRVVDEWSAEITRCVVDEVSLATSVRSGRRAPEDEDVRRDIADTVDRLGRVPAFAVPKPDGPPLRDLRKVVNLPLAAIRECLGVSQSEAMDIMRARKPLAADQVRVLADRAGVPAARIEECLPGLPALGIDEVEHPRWRGLLTYLARTNGRTEADTRLRVAHGAFALAARQSGQGDGGAGLWHQRIQRYLDAELPAGAPGDF